METDVQAFVLYRSMTNYRSSVIITRRLNELIADEPDLQDVAVALAIYPALKWSMHGADADVVMSRMCKSDEELRRLGNVQKVLVAATGFEPRFLLENRKRYFDACSELIRLLEKAIKKVGEYNAAVRFLEKAKEGTCAISFTSKINPSKECSLVIELAYPTVNFAGPQQGKTTA